jgi:hypothetical protein
MNTNKLNRRAAKNEAQLDMYIHFIQLKYAHPSGGLITFTPAKARFLAKQAVQNQASKVLKSELILG